MKTAILLIPKSVNSVDMQAYLNACIGQVDGIVLSPSHSMNMALIDKLHPVTDDIYLFTDFGMDDLMKQVMAKYEVKEMKLPENLIEKYSVTSLNSIIEKVSRITKVSIEDMRSRSRKREIVAARQFYCKRARELTGNSLELIGKYIYRDHATVLHSIKTVNNVRELSALYDYYFNKGKNPYVSTISVKDHAKPILSPLEPLKVKSEVTVRKREDSYSCVGFGAFSGYRVHQV